MKPIKPLIFVIMNSHLDIMSLETMIQRDFAVMSTTNTDDALLMYEATYASIRLVLIDTAIEGMPFLKLLKRMRDISPIPEFIVLAHQFQTEEAIQVMKDGAYHYMVTPLVSETLLITLQQALVHADMMAKLKKGFCEHFLDNIEKRLHYVFQLQNEKKQQGVALSESDMVQFFTKEEQTAGLNMKTIQTLFEKKMYAATKKNATVLVIEDEDYMRDVIRFHLSEHYRVLEAENGAFAVKTAGNEKNIDVILVDIGLPDIRGVDLIPNLKQLQPDAEIIMVTAFKDIDNIVKSFHYETCDYITKPFEMNHLVSKIESVLEKKWLKSLLNIQSEPDLDHWIPRHKKLRILDRLALLRASKNQPLLMQDIYALYPELKSCGAAPDEIVPEAAIEDGVGLFIDSLQNQMAADTGKKT